MRTRSFYAARIDFGQQFKRNLALRVGFRTMAGGSLERSKDYRFRHILQLGPAFECAVHEPRTEICSQCIAVCQEPRLHELHHKKRMIVRGTRGHSPTVVIVEILPDGAGGLDWSFAVYEEKRKSPRLGFRHFRLEPLECLVPRSTSHHPRQAILEASRFEETFPALAEWRVQCSIDASTSTLNVQHDGHHRFPPNCPELQRFPSV